MSRNSRLSSVAPVTTITISAVLTVILAVISAILAMSGPWLGVVFDRTYSGVGVRVERIVDNGPAAGRLAAGDVIVAFETPSHRRVNLSSVATLEDPDQLPTYAEYDDFFAAQQEVWEAISSPPFSAILRNGRQVELSSVPYPGFAVLPPGFWVLLIFGGASFLLGVSVWSLRQGEPVTRVLAVSGMGFMVGAYCAAIYLARELAIPGAYFFGLASGNHLGIMTFAYSSILFFWYYPKKLGNVPAAAVFVSGVAVLWLNETLQWWSWPAHAFYAHFLVAYGVLILFTTLQWRQSRGAPLERAMLKWLLATMLLSLGFTIALFYIPIILMGKSIASTVLTFGAVFALYISLVVGAIRYHQFDMHHWWLSAWQWLVFILIALLFDVLFGYFLHLSQTTSGGFAIGIGCIYLMARQWYWRRFAGNGKKALDQALPHLVDALMLQYRGGTSEQQWRQIVERVFNPLSMKTVPRQHDSANIQRSGLALQLPCLNGLDAVELFCCDRGKRLFTSTDVELADRLLELMRHSRDIAAAREEGVQEERNRIQRDLHDDVAARLLSLLHQTREPAISKVARNALRGLRDVIHLLGTEKESLGDVMTDIEAGAREQLSGLGVHFEWRSLTEWPAVMLSPQQHINLRRIAREAIANALKHAHPENVILQVGLDAKGLRLRVCSDGAITEPSSWIPGRGLNNIRSRVAEMNGSHEWGIEREGANRQYCCLTVRIPISASEEP